MCVLDVRQDVDEYHVRTWLQLCRGVMGAHLGEARNDHTRGVELSSLRDSGVYSIFRVEKFWKGFCFALLLMWL